MGWLKKKKKAFKSWSRDPITKTGKEIAKHAGNDVKVSRSYNVPNSYGDVKVNGHARVNPANGNVNSYGVGVKVNIPLGAPRPYGLNNNYPSFPK
eukprot:CAMPEP_0201571184 /NCGR_PEP_ID=MMETSP0190_2-20130828/13846_1 /ASSEMBLY_ACC=CAM_ASM_000263 /TAXON_ID=37353 /ORGANISM="Rosalina sp." /LENGTH=94 /DNA_ID=CAMNT_0047995563 /DNA_START=96 /DNA_END=380 /DNA_ORIENTATION=-